MTARRQALRLTAVALLFASMGFPPPVTAAPALGSLAGAGERAGATRLSFTAGDSVKAQVDVGSGNLLVSVKALSWAGLRANQVPIGAWYNSAASDKTPISRLGKGWGLDYTPDVKLVDHGDGTVTYTGPGGLTGIFETSSGSNYTSPAGFKTDLVKTTTGWTLTDRDSQEKLKFGTSGGLTSREDRNGNATSVNQTSTGVFGAVDLTAPIGPSSGRAVRVRSTASTGATTTLSQGASEDIRQAKFTRSNDLMTTFTDALNRQTSFTYNSTGLLTKISAPGNVVTDFTYDSSRRVTSITQVETSSGGPGNSVTRLAYPSSTQTLLASPNTDQSAAVSAVPRTTYTLNSSQRVTKTVDAEGREQSETYTANFDTASSSKADATTSNTWGANNGNSLTKTTSPTGSSQSFSYGTTSGSNRFLPTGSTDDAGNSSTYTYNGAGNQLTSTDAATIQNKVTYNSDGTVATATSPGNGTNSTAYGYTDKQVTSMQPVTGGSLGSREYTYDDLGRLRTATNGRGITATYTYDLNDKITSIGYTGGSIVTFGYDTAGRNNQRADASGTTTYAYDQLGRLTSRQHSAGGGQIKYEYDKDSNLVASVSDAGGRVTYDFDEAGEPTSLNYPLNQTVDGPRANTTFTVDDKGRRTATYLRANHDNTQWRARSLVTYDDSDRVSRVIADEGTGNSDYTRIVDTTYCYRAGTTPTGGCSGGVSTDRNKLAWKKDAITGVSTTYTYDTSGRVTKAAVAPGNDYDYTYNARNNRLTAPNQTLTYNPANQINSSGYSYDAAGNIKADPSTGSSNITYSPADQPTSVTKSGTTYNYTHAGQDNLELISQTTPDGTYDYVYGRQTPQGIPVVEGLTRTSGGTSRTAAVTSDPVTGQPLMLRTNTGMQSLYIYDGSPGSPIALITSDGYQAFGYDYDPFGVPTLTDDSGGAGVSQNPYTFATAGVQDRTTGWVHYGYRYYNPKTGSFTQQDSLDAPLNPLDANRYAYAGNDPINLIDATGQRACLKSTLAGAAGGAVTGGLTGAFTGPGALVGVGAGAAIGGIGGAATCGASKLLGKLGVED